MWIRVASRGLQKAGNSAAEYEDAFFPRDPFETQATSLRAAVADGATETSFSGEWARELAEGYCRRRFDPARAAATLPRAQRRWQAIAGAKVLPWYAQEKARQGAFSSFIGLKLTDPCLQRSSDDSAGKGGGAWRAHAVGDSCLFQVRDGRLLQAFPIAEAPEFSNHPLLASSLPRGNEETQGLVQATSGEWRSGDVFVMVTDALAQWILTQFETQREATRRRRSRGRRPVVQDSFDGLRRAMACPDRFAEWVACLRDGGELRNDDVTVLTVEVTK